VRLGVEGPAALRSFADAEGSNCAEEKRSEAVVCSRFSGVAGAALPPNRPPRNDMVQG
jgi:hypothetical protein